MEGGGGGGLDWPARAGSRVGRAPSLRPMSSPASDRPRPSLRPPGRLVVTGGAGFVGAGLVREWLARGGSALVVDDLSAGRAERLPRHSRLELVVADVARPGVLSGLLAGGAQAVVHLAARVGVRTVLLDPEGCFEANLAGARALAGALVALPAAERPRLLAASSSEVYLPRRAPLRETDPLRPLDGAGRWRYAASKRAAEELFDAAPRLFGAEPFAAGRGPVHLRLFNVVGPGQDAGTGMVLPLFVERALAGRPLPLHEGGAAVRAFAHVDEVARVLADLVQLEALPAGPLNVGGLARASVAELARTVIECAASSSTLERVDPRREVAPSFEGIAWREPCLARLAGLGVELPRRDLRAIVADVVAAQRGERGAVVGAAQGGDGCASPAS